MLVETIQPLTSDYDNGSVQGFLRNISLVYTNLSGLLIAFWFTALELVSY